MNSKQAFLVIAMVVGTASTAYPLVGGERVMLDANIEMRISITDEIGNPALDGRFLQGERIIITVTLTDMDTLKARALADEAMLYATRAERTNDSDYSAKAIEKLNDAQAAQLTAKRSLVGSPLEGLSRRVVLRGLHQLSGDRIEELELPLQPIAVTAAAKREGSDRAAVREVRWAMETSKLPEGLLSLRAEATRAQGPHSSPIAVAQFQLVPSDQATPAERSRSAYVKAHLALETQRFADAVRLAKEAVDFSPPLDYYRMASWRLLGDAQSALGDRQAALAAYREALRVAEQAFPKSDLPFILGRRIRELENER